MTQRPQGTRAPNGAASYYLGADGDWHGRVTVGVKENGKPDRRHLRGRSEREVRKKVRDIEKARDSGHLHRAGRSWTVEQWLTHWVENIAAPAVRPTTLASYRFAVNKHLIPGSAGTGSTSSNRSTWRRPTAECSKPGGSRPPPTRPTALSAPR